MFALGELAAHCQPEMSKHANEALPHVFAAMAEDDATLQEQACYALDSFCENLGEVLEQWKGLPFCLAVAVNLIAAIEQNCKPGCSAILALLCQILRLGAMLCKPCQVMNRIWPISVKSALRPCSGAACTQKAPQVQCLLCRTTGCRSLGHGVSASSAKTEPPNCCCCRGGDDRVPAAPAGAPSRHPAQQAQRGPPGGCTGSDQLSGCGCGQGLHAVCTRCACVAARFHGSQ